MNDDINDYMPSILNPRGVRKNNGDITLTQNSIVSRCSLSLRKRNVLSNVKETLCKSVSPNKKKFQNKQQIETSALPTNAKKILRSIEESTLKGPEFKGINGVSIFDKENVQNNNNIHETLTKNLPKDKTIEENSIGFSAIEDLNTVRNNNDSSPFSFSDVEINKNIKTVEDGNISFITLSSATELIGQDLNETDCTIPYDVTEEPIISVAFGVKNCETIDISTKNSNIKKMLVSCKENVMSFDCEMEESSHISIDSDSDQNLGEVQPSLPNALTVAVNLEITKNLCEDAIENSKVLILNTNDIEKVSHVIVQPPNYKLVKRQILDRSKFKNSGKRKSVGPRVKNGKAVYGNNLIQKRIDAYLNKSTDVIKVSEKTFIGVSDNQAEDVVFNDGQDMSKNLGVADAVKCDHIGRAAFRGVRKDELSPRSIRLRPKPEMESPRQTIRVSSSDARRVPSRGRNDSSSSQSPKKNVDSVQFSLAPKSKSIKTSASPRNIPHYKIVAGTHFAVDAFSYGEIPNVKHYFLTHFHSDHYSGLKKGFNKFLFCSKITADLCITRLGVNPKCIHVINFDETITVDGVEVTAVDANHCPGAVMLVFTLPNGKTLLHTGDFRASPLMESYPIFWNRDINTVYLDTTYCNPRYDFPTQDQSLEMALYLLRQKKLTLEKVGKKFSSVLIVCGTYTIGKEKFFLGMARRVGCSVWACPEKDRVLQAVEGRSFSHAPPHSCQLHVVPMRDLTHEKLRSYLESLQGAFTEVVAFKPSGWENGKNSTVENDRVTIHGIPYSEHSSFSELIRFVKFLKPKQVVPTVDISGGVKAVQKYFPCPLVCKEDLQSQSKVTDYFSIQNRQQVPAVT